MTEPRMVVWDGDSFREAELDVSGRSRYRGFDVARALRLGEVVSGEFMESGYKDLNARQFSSNPLGFGGNFTSDRTSFFRRIVGDAEEAARINEALYFAVRSLVEEMSPSERNARALAEIGATVREDPFHSFLAYRKKPKVADFLALRKFPVSTESPVKTMDFPVKDPPINEAYLNTSPIKKFPYDEVFISTQPSKRNFLGESGTSFVNARLVNVRPIVQFYRIA
jgi:hypothetical protein